MQIRKIRALGAVFALLLLGAAAASASPPPAPPEVRAVSATEVQAMEQEQAARSSKFGGGLLPTNRGTIKADGETWEILSEASLFVEESPKGKNKEDIGAYGGCSVESSLMTQTYQLAGVYIKAPECYGGYRVKKVEVQWYKQSVVERGKPVLEARYWRDACWWHCSGEYRVPSHTITNAQQVWPQVTWTFSDGARRSVTHIKWAFNSAAYPYPRVQDTRAAYGEAWLPFRIPTNGWTRCEDDATKTPTCARTSNFAVAVVQFYITNQIPTPNCSEDPKGTTPHAHHVTPVSKGGGNQWFLFDGQGALLCPSEHAKIHNRSDESGPWFSLLIPTDNI